MSIFKEWESETAADWVVIPPISEKNDVNEKVRNDYNKNRDPKTGRFAHGLYKKATSIAGANANAEEIFAKNYENQRIAEKLELLPVEMIYKSNKLFGSDYGKCSIDVANTYNECIADLSSKFNTQLQIVRPMSGMQRAANNNPLAAVSHDYTVSQATLWINDERCADLKTMVESTKKNCENGFWVNIKQGEEQKYIPTHEFAHTLLNTTSELKEGKNFAQLDYKKVKQVRSEIKAVYKRHVAELAELERVRKENAVLVDAIDMKKEPDRWIDAFKKSYEINKQYNELSVSRYALTNADEFMAECFVDVELGINPSKHSKEVYEILTKYYGR